jgi:glycerol-3-phosphate acyltransferase PlsY
MAKVFKISSLSALTAAGFAPAYMWLLAPLPGFVPMAVAMSLILIARHRSNIEKLLRGEEKKIGQKG